MFLVKYFEESRNKWKQRSVKYQSEKRELLLRIRDIERSKEKWKAECRQVKQELNKLKKKNKKMQYHAEQILT